MFHGIRFILIAVLMAWLAVSALPASERLVIDLKEEAAVESATVTLRDVADLRGPDSGQIEMLAKVSLGNAPAFGDAVLLSRRQIGEMVQKAAGILPPDSFTGAAGVRIQLRGRPVGIGEIALLIKSYILKTTAWKESEILVRSTGNLNGIELPPYDAALRVATTPAIIGQRNISIPVEIVHAGRSVRNFWVSAEVAIRADVMAAAQKIPSGNVVTEADIALQSTEITDMRASYFRSPEDLLGKVARRTFSSGSPLTRDSFAEPFLVKSGETVRLRLERDGIVLISLARAEQNGKLGQMIRVRNIDFSTLLQAQVTGEAEVQVR